MLKAKLYQDSHVTQYCGNALEVLDKAGFSRSSVIQCFNPLEQSKSFLQFFRGDISPGQSCALSFFKALAQFHTNQSLLFLDSQVGKYQADAHVGLEITSFPTVKRFAILGRWFLDSPVAAEGFVEYIYNLRRYLFESYPLIKDWYRGIANFTQFVSIPLDSYVAIAVNTSRKVGTEFKTNIVVKFMERFTHNSIISYYAKGVK